MMLERAWTSLLMDMDEDFEAAPMSPLFVDPITILDLKVLYIVIVFSKNLDQYMFFQGSNIFMENLEVGFLALWTWAFLPSYRNSLFWAIIMELRMKPNIDFFLLRAKKPTSDIPRKMFDPSKNRYWNKFLENTMILYKDGYWIYKKWIHRGSVKM